MISELIQIILSKRAIAIVVEFNDLLFVFFIDDCDIFVLIDPLVVPQKTMNIVPVLEVFELIVLILPFEYHEHAIPGCETVKLGLPDFQLLPHRGQALLPRQAK